MFRTTTLLLVMVLAAAPVSSLACDLWCTSAAAADHHRVVGCDTMLPGPSQRQHVTAIADCFNVAAIAPFVTEVRSRESSPQATLAAFEHVGPLLPSANGGSGTAVRNIPPPVAPSLHSVLRI